MSSWVVCSSSLCTSELRATSVSYAPIHEFVLTLDSHFSKYSFSASFFLIYTLVFLLVIEEDYRLAEITMHLHCGL